MRRIGKWGWVAIVVVALIIIGAIAGATGGGDDEAGQGAAPSLSGSAPKPKTLREQIEDCLDSWDGNHKGFEDQIRPGLNDEDSMETHGTYFAVTDEDGDGNVSIRMEYSAKNALGGRVKTEALGLLNYRTCRVTVIHPGY